jgi:hypothetical protein
MSAPLELFGYTKNNIAVYINTVHSHALTHFRDHPELVEVAKRALATITATEAEIRTEVDMGEPVGLRDLVETDEHDDIIYAIRVGRITYSRFCMNKKPNLTNYVTIGLDHLADDTYLLYTAFIGRLTPSFPGGNFLPEQSKAFWSTHALAWGSQEIIPDSKTTECPW